MHVLRRKKMYNARTERSPVNWSIERQRKSVCDVSVCVREEPRHL